MASKEKLTSRVLKLLELSTSDSDAEALNSVRLANKILGDAKLSWHEFFERPSPPSVAPANSQRDYRDWEPIFDDILDKGIQGDFADFVNSVYDWYQTRGYLTRKQAAAILKTWSNVTGKAA